MESSTKAKLDSELNKLISGRGFIINPIVETIHITYTKPTPLHLSKTPLKPSKVSLKSPKIPSKISSAIPLNRTIKVTKKYP